MNLDIIRPKMGTEDLLLSITENCEKLTNHTHTKPRETLEFKLIKPRENFFLVPSNNLGFDPEWMIELTSLHFFISIFKKTEENNNIELQTDLVNEFFFTELKDELAEILVISKISPEHLHDKTEGPRNVKAYRKPSVEKI